MKYLINITTQVRRIPGGIWRRVLSAPANIILNIFYGINFGAHPLFWGWPIFKGKGVVTFGNSCVLVSSRFGNPIGLFRPCIFDALNLNSKIQVGHNFSASGVCIVAQTKITIGNNVSIGANVTIVDTDFHAINCEGRRNSTLPKSIPVVIEDDVWIGMNVVILKGVTIGQGAVIGANCVVSKNVPANKTLVSAKNRLLG